MSFARAKNRPSPAQRRVLMLVEQFGSWSTGNVRPRTLTRVVELGLAEVRCDGCGTVRPAERARGHALHLTDRGRKYLANWRRAYGAGVTA